MAATFIIGENMLNRMLNRLRTLSRPPRPAIVMYHRVARVAIDPWGLAISPENFTAQIELMRRHRAILPIAEFVVRAHTGKLPNNAVALTFDDGYVDNLTDAAPILAQADVPATLFLATGPCEHAERYWWDSLAAMILDAPSVEASVDINGARLEIILGAHEPQDSLRENWRAWEPRTQREHLHYKLWERLRPLSVVALKNAMDSLCSVFGEKSTSCPRPMTPTEIRVLAAESPFTINSHTVDHVDLPMHDATINFDQIHGGVEGIRRLLGYEARGFAYPYGRNNPATHSVVKAAGCVYACTTDYGFIRRSFNPYSLPRLTAPDVSHIDWLMPMKS
jgi:peptidoglycan/xylan/chitin deacetylase (PgdA/CDA1 family)